MTTELFIEYYKEEIANEYLNNWNDMWEAIITIAKKQYNDICNLFNKSKEEIKEYMFEKLRQKKVELKDIDVLNIF